MSKTYIDELRAMSMHVTPAPEPAEDAEVHRLRLEMIEAVVGAAAADANPINLFGRLFAYALQAVLVFAAMWFFFGMIAIAIYANVRHPAAAGWGYVYYTTGLPALAFALYLVVSKWQTHERRVAYLKKLPPQDFVEAIKGIQERQQRMAEVQFAAREFARENAFWQNFYRNNSPR